MFTGEAAKFGSPGYEVPEIKKMAAVTDREIDVESPQGAAEVTTAPSDSMLEPLSFPESSSGGEHECAEMPGSDCVPCMFCERMFKNTEGKNDTLLHHLLLNHQLVIADVAHIPDMKSYCHYWKKRFLAKPIKEFCSVININTKPNDIGPKIQYYFLCDALPEEKQLRVDLQRKKLVDVLECQQQERMDTQFSRQCLFCKEHMEGNRSLLLSHMAAEHGFNVGLPDNIVHVDEFLDLLEEKLKSLQCLYCEKTFRDLPTLKNHMRKKLHKRINPKNHAYDKFYVINYLELGKSWEEIQNEDDSEEKAVPVEIEEEWSDWVEEQPSTVCLFCETSSSITAELLQHMKAHHHFDFIELINSLELDFYSQVRLVNFIRRQVYQCRCIYCKGKFSFRTELYSHMQQEKHFKLPENKSDWEQPQYYFPTYENDALLCSLEDDGEEDDQGCKVTGNFAAASDIK